MVSYLLISNRFKNKRNLYLMLVIIGALILLFGSFFLKNKSKNIKSTQVENVLNVNPQNSAEQKVLNACLTTAYKNFMKEWNTNCKKSGINNRQPNCNLPTALSDSVNKHWTDTKNKCYKGN